MSIRPILRIRKIGSWFRDFFSRRSKTGEPVKPIEPVQKGIPSRPHDTATDEPHRVPDAQGKKGKNLDVDA